MVPPRFVTYTFDPFVEAETAKRWFPTDTVATTVNMKLNDKIRKCLFIDLSPIYIIYYSNSSGQYS